MVDPSSLGPAGNGPLNPAKGIAPDKNAKQESAEGAGGAQFHALLDKLQQQARSLSADSEQVDKPEELSGAVDRARDSLNDALSLSDQLLEAYRQATHDPDAKDGDKRSS